MAKRRLASPLLVGSIVLIVLAGVLAYPRLVLYVETQSYTRRIPTAPVLSSTEVRGMGAASPALLPVNDGDEGLPPATPSLTPTLLTTSGALRDTPRATALPVSTPLPTATPTPVWSGTTPTNLSIPSIDLDAPVVAIGWTTTTVDGQSQAIWDVPDEGRVGWHNTSAPLGVVGNTVLNGHNTSKGEVFRDLYKVGIGAQIFVDGADGEVYVYRVEQMYILREAGQPLSVRLENARYIQETADNRLTLITCHPYGSLANRLVVIAFPVTESSVNREGAN